MLNSNFDQKNGYKSSDILKSMQSLLYLSLITLLLGLFSSCSASKHIAKFEKKFVIVTNNKSNKRLTVQNDSIIMHGASEGLLANQTFFLGVRYDGGGKKLFFLGQEPKVIVSHKNGFYLKIPEIKSTTTDMFFLPVYIINKQIDKLRLVKPFTDVDFANELGKMLRTNKQEELELTWTTKDNRVYLDGGIDSKNGASQSWKIELSPCQPFQWEDAQKELDISNRPPIIDVNTSLPHHIVSPTYQVFTIYNHNQSGIAGGIKVHNKHGKSYYFDENAQQVFHFQKQKDDSYTIVNKALNKAITINKCNEVYHTTLDNRKTQRFVFEQGSIDPMAVKIRSAYSNHYLTLSSKLYLDKPNATIKQEFRIIKNANVQVKSMVDGKSVQIENANRTEALSYGIFKLNQFSVGSKDNTLVLVNDKLFFRVKPNQSTPTNGAGINGNRMNWELKVAWDRGDKIAKIATNARENIWVLTNNNKVYRLNFSSKSLYYWEQQNEQTNIDFKEISLGDNGTLWGLTSSGKIYKYKSKNDWELVPNQLLKSISLISQNEVWGISMDGALVHFNGYTNDWDIKAENNTVEFLKISAGTAFDVWMLDTNGLSYYYDHNSNTILKSDNSPIFSTISVGNDGTIWGIDGCHTIHSLVSNNTWKDYIYSAKEAFPNDCLFLADTKLQDQALKASTAGGKHINTFIDSFNKAIEKYNEDIEENKNANELAKDKSNTNSHIKSGAGEIGFVVAVGGVVSSIVAYNVAATAAAVAAFTGTAMTTAAVSGGTAAGAATTAAAAGGAAGGLSAPMTAGVALVVAAVVLSIAIPLILAAQESNINIIVVNDTDVALYLDGNAFIKHGSLTDESKINTIPPRSFGPSISYFAFEKNYGLIGTEGVVRFKSDACKSFPTLAIGWGVPYRDDGLINHKNKAYTRFKPASNEDIYDDYIDNDLSTAIVKTADTEGDYIIYSAINDAETLFPIMVVYIKKK